MTVKTSAGTTLAVSAGLPATEDSAGYAALSWTDVGEITDLGEFGKVYNLVTHNPLATRRTVKKKVSFNDGSISLALGLDSSDAGQAILDAAVDSDANYSFRVTDQDSDIDYFQAIVMSKPKSIGSVDSITSSTSQLEITTEVVAG